jgi:shikimate kinase
MRIYLIGYSYSGKTTLARDAARLLGWQYFDTDKAIEIKYHTSISTFFSHYGEQAFRIIERQILQSTAQIDNAIISTGGGTPCNDDNIRFILQHGTAVHLQMSVDDIMQRIAHARRSRPLLKDKTPEQVREYITEQLQLRLPYYNQAQLTLPAFNANAQQLVDLLTKTEVLR